MGGRSLTPSFGKFSSAIHDVRYRLSWGLLIEEIETGGRALIPYGWEQIGSKQVTSSQMQMWSAQRHAGWEARRVDQVGMKRRNAASSRSGLMCLVYRGPQGIVASRIARSSRSWPGW